MAWHHLQYALGLAQLGHDVYFVEDSDDYPSCYDPTRLKTDVDPSYGLGFAADVFTRVGLGERWTYYDAHTTSWLGPCASRIADVFATAEVLLNVSGVNPLRPWLMQVPRRVLIDTDPAFTQIRHLTNPEAHSRASAHTEFFSFGENIHSSSSEVPDDGFQWTPTRQPIVLDAWPVTPGPPNGRFTTVMVWEAYKPLQYAGRSYGLKSTSFGPYLEMPSRAASQFEVALGSPPAPRQVLRDHGWSVRNPLHPTRDLWAYQDYIRSSKAEFSIAKEGYVVTRSGWFSDRSAAYLASGRPVVTQETGFSDNIPIGEGLFSFSTLDEAVAAVEEVESRYDFHCRAARAVAEEYFDSRNILASLIDNVTASAIPSAKRTAQSSSIGSFTSTA